MRHLVLALMIALLPIRGWVGEVMATDMASSKASQLQNATKMVAAHVDGAGAGGHFGHAATDSPMPAAAPDCAGHGTQEGDPMADAHGESCTVCHACHTVALFPLIPAMPSPMASPAVPRSPAARFASAIAAPGQKPPIS
jgi:hypothetical protein